MLRGFAALSRVYVCVCVCVCVCECLCVCACCGLQRLEPQRLDLQRLKHQRLRHQRSKRERLDLQRLMLQKQFLELHMVMLISRMHVALAVALAMGLTPRNEQSCGKHRCVTTAPMTLQKYCIGASSCRGPSFNGLDSVSKLSDPHCLPQAGTESWKQNV